MSDENIIDLFKTDKEDTEVPNYRYHIVAKEGEEYVEDGYLIMTGSYTAVCRGAKGILYLMVPSELIRSVKNLGAVSEFNSLVN